MYAVAPYEDGWEIAPGKWPEESNGGDRLSSPLMNGDW